MLLTIIKITYHLLNMAPGLKLGDRVQADTVAVLGSRCAGDVCGHWAHKRVLHGLVAEVVGTGYQQKFKIKWNECSSSIGTFSAERQVVTVGITANSGT